ncbi:glycosyltransferase family 4 protein [Lactobacillus amylovorus]|uniref:glycosyltransferase family 4 protein n=1 Tax=Lactobacillus amylovorus TaxID=1604 RepID=UPI0021A5CFC8|nr:glycosyltransferase family 4 protein [Lactobacillus amylovorus]
MIKIGYVSPVNPEKDRMAWSGTYYNTFQAIKNAGVEVKWISYTKHRFLFKGLTKSASLLYKIKYGKGSSTHSRLMSQLHSLFINSKSLNDVDLLFIPGQIDIVAGIKKDIPKIYYTDGTFKRMVNYYWFDFSSRAIREGNRMEKLAVQNATYNFRASHWAAKSTIEDYGANKNNTYVFPFGADVPNTIKKAKIPDYKNKKLKLLFSGKEWERKGGDIAVEAVNYLNSVGINSRLYIVGISELPKSIKNTKYLKFIGYLDKNDANDYKKYLNLYHECNAFILPTRAECAGLVFAESNAFGMPIFTTDTGGIADYVIDGKNGYRLPLSASGVNFGKCIERAYKNQEFGKLSNGSREVYLSSTSWKAWSDHFKYFIEKDFR